MLNLTPVIRPYFSLIHRRRKHWLTADGLEATQRRLLDMLLRRAADTEIGRRYGFTDIDGYAAFADAVPSESYESIRPLVMRMIAGERDVLWPGRCRRFAQSSGTSGGKSKYIPVTADGLKLNHYAGAAESVASYLALNPRSRLFSGSSFILGGSFANELTGLSDGVKVGDLSANLIDDINPLVDLVRIPSRSTALMADWQQKLPCLIAESAAANVTNISGVPSWFLTVLRGVLEHTGASTIHQVWPDLEVFFHGGIAFGPYRSQYASITDASKMHYIENYNASEGFFAVQDTADSAAGMLLLADAGVFYEFVPLGGGKALPAWEVEPGAVYEMLISSVNGLWRYSLGDTVRIESVEPLRISIAGRTGSFINAFGEELMVWNADTAISEACHRTHSQVANYTAAPVFTTDTVKGHHQWIIEWSEPPADMDLFCRTLDAELQRVNSDYQAKRSGGIFLDRPDIVSVGRGTFDRWLAASGRLGGQRKVPRLANDRHIADSIISMITKTTI